MTKFLKLNERSKHEMLKVLPDDDCITRLADYFQNFSDQTRIKILSCLSIMDMCVNDISNILNLNQTTVSHQLKTLKDQGIVEYQRDGKILIYRLKSQYISEMMMYAVKVI